MGAIIVCSRIQLQQVLSEIQTGLYNIFGEALEQVLLYGSYARGDQDNESDIDVMALVNMSKERLAKYRHAVNHFSSEIDLQYDVFSSIKLQDTNTFYRYADVLPFFQNVNREGIRIE